MQTLSEPATYSAVQVSRMLNIPRSTIYWKAQTDPAFQKDFGVIRVGDRVRFKKTTVDKHIY